MVEDRNWFDKLALNLEEHRLGVQYGAYSLAIVGLAVSLRSVRPFKRFVNPREIPASFIKRQMRLSGRVLRVDPGSGETPTTLVVDHFPVISLRRSTNNGLPVQIASVDLTANGISWLNHVVVGKDINFTLLQANPHSVSCIVQKEKQNIGLDLVTLGFASVSPIEHALQKDATYLPYYKTLLSARKRAERNGVGMWHADGNRGVIMLNKIISKINKPVKSLYEQTKSQLTRKKVQLATN